MGGAGGGRGLLGVNTRGASQRSTPCLSRDNSHSQQNSSSGGTYGRETVRQSGPAPLVTVINADEAGSGKQLVSGNGGGYLGCRAIISGAPSPRQLSRQGSSIESSTVHTHTVECTGSQGSRLHQPLAQHSRGSPTSAECDFHCCSLHGTNNNHKTVATSPVQVRQDLLVQRHSNTQSCCFLG